MRRFIKFAIFLALFGVGSSKARVVLVEDGVSQAPIVVPADASPSAVQAANELADYIEKITGARAAVLTGDLDQIPDHAIWVGYRPELKALFPNVDFDFEHPEEIQLAGNDRHVAIVGRDRQIGTKQTEHGTANAVYTFLQHHLGVRWLWPGPLGEDIVPTRTITLEPFEYRFHPPIRERKFWRGMYSGEMEENKNDWFRFNRSTLGSLEFHGGHAYMNWWDRYHETHPDIFALQPDGNRTVVGDPKNVKLCVSNPDVAELWLENAVQKLDDDPALITVSASPNDGVGFCVCENCRAMDAPDGPPMWGYVALTDRYVKYWNELARDLKERFPDREALVGAYAYSAYTTPPLHITLEPNIAIGYVGHFPMASEAHTAKDQANWLDWSKMASQMVYRPNQFHYSGGWLNLPTLSMQNTIESFRFLAENRCVGIQVDTLPLVWSTQGLQYYVMAQMAYDPFQDGEALLQDYYSRGFGPAADYVAQYYSLMERAHGAVLERITLSSGKGGEMADICGEVFSKDLMAEAAALLDKATAATAEHNDGRYRQRVEFLRVGCDFTALQGEIIRQMAIVRASKGADTKAVANAIALCKQRDKMHEDHYEDFALRRGDWYVESRHVQDHVGPPTGELLRGSTDGPAPDTTGFD